MNIKNNIVQVTHNIAQAAEKTGRSGTDVALVCVTKQIPALVVQEAVEAGALLLGENRVAETIEKRVSVTGAVAWHMIGHLQTRKVKDAVAVYSLIQSVDSVRLAREIDKRSQAINKIQDILIEVNVSGEEAKYGFSMTAVIPGITEIAQLPNVRIQGVMTMAPFVDDPEETRPVFKESKKLFDELTNISIPQVSMKWLSMGMTQDYMVAVAEGANMVRIGTALFQ